MQRKREIPQRAPSSISAAIKTPGPEEITFNNVAALIGKANAMKKVISVGLAIAPGPADIVQQEEVVK